MVSNKTLALLIVATVIVSLGGTLISINKLDRIRMLQGKELPTATGYAAGAGNVTLTIGGTTACVVSTNVSFGTGSAPGSPVQITTDMNAGTPLTGMNDCSGTSATCGGLVINNTGNTQIQVNASSSKNASNFITGSSVINTDYRYLVRNGTLTGATSAGCLRGLGQADWTSMPAAEGGAGNITVCNNLSYESDLDQVTLEFNLTIRPDTSATAKTTTINVNCEQSVTG